MKLSVQFFKNLNSKYQIDRDVLDVQMRMFRFIFNDIHIYVFVQKLWDVGLYCDTSVYLT